MNDIANGVTTLNVTRHIRGEPNENTVRILEQMLLLARSGDMLHVKNRSALGALEIIKHDVLHRTK